MMDQKGCAVRIERIAQEEESLLVCGTVRKQPGQAIEVMLNGDALRRHIVNSDSDVGQWCCRIPAPPLESVEIEASIREYEDFHALLQTVPDDSFFELDGHVVWGACVTEGPDGLYYMIFSHWKETQWFGADWAVYSELGYAVSASLAGPYVYRGKALDANYSNVKNKQPVVWEGVGQLEVFHNPTILHSKKDGMYYLYFMGTNASEGNYQYDYSRNHQRIGVAYAATPAGPWTISEEPLIDVREGMYDSLLTANPSVTEVGHADGSYTYHIVYKAVSRQIEQDKVRDIVVSGYGEAETPLGPFIRSNKAIMKNPERDFSIEDCYLWHRNDTLYALAKDVYSYFTGAKNVPYSYALFVLEAGEEWKPSGQYPLAYVPVIPWQRGEQSVTNLERAQLYIKSNIPIMMCAATTKNGGNPCDGNVPINVQIPLLGRRLAHDTKTIRLREKCHAGNDKLDVILEKAQRIDWEKLSEDEMMRTKSLIRAIRILKQRFPVSLMNNEYYIGLFE